MRRILLASPLVIVALAVLLWSQHRASPRYASGFVESHQIGVGSRIGGRVELVHVEEGVQVAAGAPLFELNAYDLKERRAQAAASLAASEALLEKLRAGPREQEIAQARATSERMQAALEQALAGPRPLEIEILEDQLALVETELVKAQQDQTRIAKLFEQGQAAEEELDEANCALGVAQARVAQARDELALAREGTRAEEISAARARLAEAEQALALLEAGTRTEDIAEAEAQVESARAAVAVIDRQLAELIVHAPVDSTVEAIDLRPGDLVAPNAPVVSLSDPSELWVRAYVPENGLDITLGQTVSVRVDSYPDEHFAGHISFIARQAEFTPSNVQTSEERSKQVFRIKVILDEGLDKLRAGMAADVFLEPES